MESTRSRMPALGLVPLPISRAPLPACRWPLPCRVGSARQWLLPERRAGSAYYRREDESSHGDGAPGRGSDHDGLDAPRRAGSARSRRNQGRRASLRGRPPRASAPERCGRPPRAAAGEEEPASARAAAGEVWPASAHRRRWRGVAGVRAPPPERRSRPLRTAAVEVGHRRRKGGAASAHAGAGQDGPGLPPPSVLLLMPMCIVA
jgi:hypothetical protein